MRFCTMLVIAVVSIISFTGCAYRHEGTAEGQEIERVRYDPDGEGFERSQKYKRSYEEQGYGHRPGGEYYPPSGGYGHYPSGGGYGHYPSQRRRLNPAYDHEWIYLRPDASGNYHMIQNEAGDWKFVHTSELGRVYNIWDWPRPDEGNKKPFHTPPAPKQ